MILALVIGIGLLIKAFIPSSNNEAQNTHRPSSELKPTEITDNDKIVTVKNVNDKEIKQVIQQFCDVYNQETFRALPILSSISEKEFVITFPYDIDFETFCYFVNYLHYPNDIIYDPEIIAWGTTKSGDSWMTDELINKQVMLYIPEDDQDYDNVYLTTSDDLGYKMGFAMGEESRPLDKPCKMYQAPAMQLSELKDKESVRFE